MAALVPPQWRFGKTYRRTKRLIADGMSWDEPGIERWQTERLRQIIAHAFDHVPAYHLLYTENRVSPRDFQHRSDIDHFPFVTKEMIRDNLKDFTSRSVPTKRLLYRTTGGSTGIPFGFNLTEEDVERELAFMHSAWEEVGWRIKGTSVILRGAFVGSADKFWKYDPPLHELHLSTYHLTESTYDAYRQKILEWNPDYLQAYPSAATLFADLIRTHNDEATFAFRLLLLGSENLYPWQVGQLQKAFPSARIFGWYGHAEQVLFAPLCPSGSSLHLHPQYGYGEILGPTDAPVALGDRGELIGSSFWNLATPFIRYRTRDIAIRGPQRCESCGRPVQILERIEGRLQEFIQTGTGRLISMTQINMHSDVFDNVRQFQFHQNEAGKVTFRIVRKPSYTDDDTARIRRELEAKLGNDMQLTIEFVGQISPLPSGKVGFLHQELSLAHGDHGRRS